MTRLHQPIASDFPPAIVLGMSPTGLAVIRALGSHNIEVWGNDIDWYRSGYFSKYCRVFGRINPLSEETLLLEQLLTFGRKTVTKPVIFPTDDEYLAFLANYREVLQPYFRFSDLDPKLIDQFLNKRSFHELCQHHGIHTPATFTVRDETQLAELSMHISYPAIIKPIYSHLWALKYGFLKVIEVHSKSELQKAYATLGAMKSNVMVQEIIAGGDEQIYIFSGYFNQRSEPLRIFTGRKIRQYPPNYGTTTVAESVWEPRVADLSIRLLQQVHFQGLCDVEFKKDPKDGQFKIIEINPRVGRWHSLTDASGADLTYTAYLDLIGITSRADHTFQEHIKWVFLLRDLVSVLPQILRGHMSLFKWIQSLRGRRVHAIFSWKDPLPALAYLLEMAIKGINGLRRRRQICS